MKFLKTILLACLATTMIGCVGTVQESKTKENLFDQKSTSTFNFSGLSFAKGIAHDKIEVEFYPADGTNVSYKLYVNDTETPLDIDPQALTPTYGGRFLYTLKNLSPNMIYKLKLSALKADGSKSKNETVLFAQTYDNRVADFQGIKKVSLQPGNTARGIIVEWIPTTMSGLFNAGPFDPIHYEVKVISEVGGVINLNSSTYQGSDLLPPKLIPTPPAQAGPFENPSSITIDNLRPDTTYFVQVRAINLLYDTWKNADPIPVDRERNTKYLSIKTASNTGFYSFDQDNVVLTNPPGFDAFDKINVFWRAASGPFTGYRIFARKYDGLLNAQTDDLLTDAQLNLMTQNLEYESVSSGTTSAIMAGLETDAYYQVKVVLCKVSSCPIDIADANNSIKSTMKSIKVSPTLAPFTGIYDIGNPGQFSDKDVVTLKFDPPIVSAGYANLMEFYCVNPNNLSEMTKFDGTNVISGSGISSCEGLYLEDINPSLSSYRAQKVKGLPINGTNKFCFAATPAILAGVATPIRLPAQDRIVRCSFPEIQPPSNKEFPGLNNSCVISGVTATLSWPLPTAGVYSGFKLFWKEKNSRNYSFPAAVSGSLDYTSSPELGATITTHTLPDLVPGRTYQVGVLATVDMDAPVPDVYSEYNLKVIECAIPLPTAIFNGFSRILALGPKLDGRVPNSSGHLPPVQAQMYEAINQDGIPYEVRTDATGVPSASLNFVAPPGRDYGLDFIGNLDGKKNTEDRSMSRTGIVSLAWEDVTLSSTEAQTMYESNQSATSRSDRPWGYKIYRSSDNKLTWELLSNESSNIYSMNYTYRVRSNSSDIIKRMAFFTDYSVNSLKEFHDSANGRDIERARIYFYRIVPTFDGKPMTVTNGSHNVVRVTLPPPNMALVHRWMANRARCLELGLSPTLGDNYSCKYTGIGATPASLPHRVDETNLDLASDLLVDRYELGCKYTRGDLTVEPKLGASEFRLPPASRRDPNDNNYFPLFDGHSTFDNVISTNVFKGCTGDNSDSRLGDTEDYPSGFEAKYQRFLQGDCVGRHQEQLASSACSAAAFSINNFSNYSYGTPGAGNSSTIPDCSVNPANSPTNAASKYGHQYGPNYSMQSEFLAVFHNAGNRPNRVAPTFGPAPVDVRQAVVKSNGDDIGAVSNCWINLAAIDGSGFMKPRWMNLNERVSFGGSSTRLLDKTVSQLTAIASNGTTLFNGSQDDGTLAEFKVPKSSLRTSNRYRSTTKIAKIMTSNSAKLPPILGIGHDMANTLCEQSYVQVGIGSDTTFIAASAVKAKRSMTRMEFVASASWPETFSDVDISQRENSTSGGSCNNRTKNITGSFLSKGNYLNNSYPRVGSVLTPGPFSALVTGSSEYSLDHQHSAHTEGCISRYGIQDIIGNMAEIGPEYLRCDYSEDQAFVGQVNGTWSPSDIKNKGDSAAQLPISSTEYAQRYDRVLLEGTIGGVTQSFKITFRDSTPPITNARPWVRSTTDSGYCAFTDNNPSRRSGLTNYFRDLNGTWEQLFNPDGTTNPDVLSVTQRHPAALLDWRNGDGRFMDFGPMGLGLPFSTSNGLSLTTGVSKYFNPILGFPLNCNGTSCADSILTQQDNPKISTTPQIPNLTGTDTLPTINNFPIGNSNFTHPGLSTYSSPLAGFDTFVLTAVGPGFRTAITQLEVDDPISMGNPIVSTVPSAAFDIPSTVKVYSVNWEVFRNTVFMVANGGSSNTIGTGRFTADIQPQESHLVNNSVRCAVRINQD